MVRISKVNKGEKVKTQEVKISDSAIGEEVNRRFLIDWKQKLIVFASYAGNICFCGKQKKDFRWLCVECREKLCDSVELKALDESCEKHFEQALIVMRMCKGYIK